MAWFSTCATIGEQSPSAASEPLRGRTRAYTRTLPLSSRISLCKTLRSSSKRPCRLVISLVSSAILAFLCASSCVAASRSNAS